MNIMILIQFRQFLLFFLLVGSSTLVFAQSSSSNLVISGWPSGGFSSEITESDLYSQIGFLASDSLKGRKPGMPEEKIAAVYIKEVFAKTACITPDPLHANDVV